MNIIRLSGKDDLTLVRKLREDVFLKEQQAETSMKEDVLDLDSIHLLLMDENHPAATGRLYERDSFFKIGRIAVAKEFRGRGLGEQIVRALLEIAFTERNSECVLVSAQIHAVKFYERFGFAVCGNEMLEEGVRSVDMKLDRLTWLNYNIK